MVRQASVRLLLICAAVLVLSICLPLLFSSEDSMIRHGQLIKQWKLPRKIPNFSLFRARNSSAMSNSGQHESQQSQDGAPQGQVLGLPGPGKGRTTNLDVSTGQSVALDHLGPMVVNKDGSLSRIDNWQGMTQQEKDSTLKIIGRRNKQRLEALKAQNEQGTDS